MATIHFQIGGVTVTIVADPQDIPAPALSQLLGRMDGMSQALDDLTREVQETATVVDSAIVLIQGLRDQLVAAGTDPQKLAELAASLDAKQAALAAAIAGVPEEETPIDPALENQQPQS